MANPAVTPKASGTDWAFGNSVTSGSFSATAGDLLVVLVGHGLNHTLSNISTSGIVIDGTWTIGPEDIYNQASVAIAWAKYASGTGTVTATWSGSDAEKMISVLAVSGYDTADPIVSKTTDSTHGWSNQPSLTIVPSVDAGNAICAAVFIDNYPTGDPTPDQGIEAHDLSGSSNSSHLSSMYDDSSPGSTVSWGTLTESEDWSIAAIEINAEAAPPSGIVPFRRRIEGY